MNSKRQSLLREEGKELEMISNNSWKSEAEFDFCGEKIFEEKREDKTNYNHWIGKNCFVGYEKEDNKCFTCDEKWIWRRN